MFHGNYHVTPAYPGYGARIWISQSRLTERVIERLNFLSNWGGHDKESDGDWAWEFNETRFEEACSYLEGYGFNRVNYSGLGGQ